MNTAHIWQHTIYPIISQIVTIFGVISIIGLGLRKWIKRELLDPIKEIYRQTGKNHHESVELGLDPTLHDRIDDLSKEQKASNRVLTRHLVDAKRDKSALYALQTQVNDLHLLFQTFTESQPDMWRAIEAVANAEPPKKTEGD